MTVVLGYLGPFLFYWLVLFVTCFAVVEFGQNYLYDETTKSPGLKVAGGSALLALVLMFTRTEFQTMFTAELGWTVLLGVTAFVVFTLIFRFQPWHALPIGLLSVFLISGTATMGVQSFSNRDRPIASQVQPQAKPLRRSTRVNVTPPKAEDAKAPAAK